jgi:hypothetical protein
MSDTNEATAAFADALRTMAASLDELPGKLEGVRVHDYAFGKLFEAAEVRDAYHLRQPETMMDLAEATEVIVHFVAGLEGGHPIGPRAAGPPPPSATIPAQDSGRVEP